MAKGPYGAIIETEKSARSPSTKNAKRLCKSTCYAVTNLEPSSVSTKPDSYTSIASAVTPRMLSKQKISPHSFFSNHTARTGQNGLLQMSIASCGKRYFIRSLPVSILLKVGPSTLKSFSNQYFTTASTRH